MIEMHEYKKSLINYCKIIIQQISSLTYKSIEVCTRTCINICKNSEKIEII